MDQAQQIKKRLAELQNRGTFGGYTVYTDFLGLEEQSLLAEMAGPQFVPAYGGFDGAELFTYRGVVQWQNRGLQNL